MTNPKENGGCSLNHEVNARGFMGKVRQIVEREYPDIYLKSLSNATNDFIKLGQFIAMIGEEDEDPEDVKLGKAVVQIGKTERVIHADVQGALWGDIRQRMEQAKEEIRKAREDFYGQKIEERNLDFGEIPGPGGYHLGFTFIYRFT